MNFPLICCMMKAKLFICTTLLFLVALNLKAQKLDTTVTMNGEGYRVVCSNKDLDNNYVTLTLVKLPLNNSRQIDFPIKGKVVKAVVDDLNDDGQPDLIICWYNGANYEMGNVIGISYSKADKSIVPIYFPDIYTDPKIREGYKGYDTFSLTIGTLMRKFPIYLANDAPDKPTGGIRTVQYNVVSEQGRLKFKVLRTFETQPEN